MPTTEEQDALNAKAAADKAAAEEKAAADKAAVDKAAAEAKSAAEEKAKADKAAAEALAERAKDPRYVARLEHERNEAEAKLRESERRAKEAQDKLDALDKAAMAQRGDFEALAKKTAKELEEARAAHAREIAAINDRLILNAVHAAAMVAGMRDADDAAKFIDKSGLKVTDERVEGAVEAIAKLKVERPYLFKSEEGDAATTTTTKARRPVQPAVTRTDSKLKDAADMDDAEFAKAGKIFGFDRP